MTLVLCEIGYHYKTKYYYYTNLHWNKTPVNDVTVVTVGTVNWTVVVERSPLTNELWWNLAELTVLLRCSSDMLLLGMAGNPPLPTWQRQISRLISTVVTSRSPLTALSIAAHNKSFSWRLWNEDVCKRPQYFIRNSWDANLHSDVFILLTHET